MYKFFLILLICLIPVQAAADGCFVWRNQAADIREPAQKALIIQEDGWQDLILSVRYEGAVEDFGWLVPLPAEPEMTALDGEIFAALSKATQEPVIGRWYLAAGEVLAGITVMPTVTRQRVGIYDAAVLAGGNTAGVRRWLADNDFVLGPGAEPILSAYLDDGWVFVAMRVAPEEVRDTTAEQLGNGEIQPIHFRFPAQEPVFPLRISSLGGHPSEVLIYTLSPDGLVPESVNNVAWEVAYFGKIPWYWLDQIDWLAELHDRPGETDTELRLTKARAVFQPAQMQDLRFVGYPYAAKLESTSLRERVEAASYIGYQKTADAAPLLESFLRGAKLPDTWQPPGPDRIPPAQDLASALWALGEVGDQANTATVDAYARGKSSVCRLEALAALRNLSPETALRTSVFLLGNPLAGHEAVSHNDAVTRLAMEILIEHGGVDERPALQAIIDKDYEPRSWNGNWARSHGRRQRLYTGKLALLAAAACGDTSAADELLRILRQAGTYCSFHWIYQNDRLPGGHRNHHPRAVIPDRALRFNEIPNGDIVQDMCRWYKTRPALRDSLFRQMALAPLTTKGLATDFRAILLARVASLGPDDEVLLRDLWEQAAEIDDRYTFQMPTNWRGDEIEIELNIDAVAVAYALGVQGRVETLQQLWTTTSWDESQLKAELAVALTLTKDPAAVPQIEAYIATAWGLRARDTALIQHVAIAGDRSQYSPEKVSFDLNYRRHDIVRYLEEQDPQVFCRLARDAGLPPLLRLNLLLQTHLYRQRPTCRPDPCDILAQIELEVAGTPLAVAVDRLVQRHCDERLSD